MHDRKLVYNVIDEEREYQDSLPLTRTDGSSKTVGDYVVMMQYYQNQLVEEWTMNPGDKAALNVIRKIAAIAVHCMEDHGVEKRFDIESLMSSRGRPVNK